MSDLIPNSFQTPNAYVDRFMYLVTPEEWKVLSYAARRIFGFQKRQDRISQSQFTHGTVSTKDGSHLDHGTGLSKPAVIKALQGLIEYRIMIKVANNDKRFNEGVLYELQLDSDQIDIAGLIERANRANHIALTRTETARRKAAEKVAEKVADKARSVPLTGHEDETTVSGTDVGRSVGLTGVGQSDRRGSVSGTNTQNQEETNRKPRGNQEGDATAEKHKKSKQAKEADPLLKHPAVIAYRDVMHLTPNDVQRKLIAERVGNNGHIDDWRAVLTDWKAHSWKPGNVPGQLEAFAKKTGAHYDSTSGNAAPAQPTAEQKAAAERINAARSAKAQH